MSVLPGKNIHMSLVYRDTKVDLILTVQWCNLDVPYLCMSYSIYRQTYVIINWQILTINPGLGVYDEVNQLQMGIYNIEENSWTITPLFGFSISGGKS